MIIGMVETTATMLKSSKQNCETSQYFLTRIHEHLYSDRSSHIFKRLQNSEPCRASCSIDCFKMLDSAATEFQVKLKESMYIKWEKPDLNQQVKR